jgi:hypothetical protein
MRWSWTALKNPMIYSLQARKTTKTFLRTCQSPGRDFIPGPSKHEEGEYNEFNYDEVLGFAGE